MPIIAPSYDLSDLFINIKSCLSRETLIMKVPEEAQGGKKVIC